MILSGSANSRKVLYQTKKEGFTLLEILISITLLTVILGAVYSSFFTTKEAIEKFDTVAMKYQEARTALDQIRREIEAAFITDRLQEEKSDENIPNFIIEDRDIFGKNASRMSLTAFSFRGTGIQRVAYITIPENNGLKLLKTVSPVTLYSENDTISPNKVYTSDILQGIEAFTVETFYNNKWVRTWNAKEIGTLPENIRITIEFSDRGNTVSLTEYAEIKFGRQLYQ
jgi:type II secretion system protein J